MGWEDRNGNLYYYRKKRVGNRVLSEYVGSGILADWVAEEDDLRREKRRQERLAWEEIEAEQKKMDSELNLVGDLSRSLIRANLLIAGFHPHKGQWRRRRSG